MGRQPTYTAQGSQSLQPLRCRVFSWILVLASLFLVAIVLTTVFYHFYPGAAAVPVNHRDEPGKPPLLAQRALDHGDYAAALPLLISEAEEGRVDARYALGVLYEKGRGVDINYEQAYHWYRLAAEDGHGAAQYALARLYAYGQGVPQDTAQASIWSQRAIDGGYGEQQKPEPGSAAEE